MLPLLKPCVYLGPGELYACDSDLNGETQVPRRE